MPLKEWESYCFNITESELNASLISANKNNNDNNKNGIEIVTLFIGILIGFIVGIIHVFVMLWYQPCDKGRLWRSGSTRHEMQELTGMSSVDDTVVKDRMRLVANRAESDSTRSLVGHYY